MISLWQCSSLIVEDYCPPVAYSGDFELHNGANLTVEYYYDKNGNLCKDLDRGIDTIQYNCLNLPQVIAVSDGSSISYLYDIEGNKRRVIYQQADGTTRTLYYSGGVIYDNGKQQRLLTEEGYVTLSDNKYHYYLKDHQGNIRVVANQDGTVEEVNHYYPFGGVFTDGQDTSVQPYKYNGKELETANGLNWYDYGARMYDPALCRFHVQDFSSENYYPTSPYTYCINNPLIYVDPLGTDTVMVNDKSTRPEDRGVKGKTYTAKIEVIQNGEVVGVYRGSSYPNSVSNSDNSPKWNTIKEGEYDYNNVSGHKGGTQKGLNIVDEKGERVVPGVTPKGEDVEIKYANVHAGYSDLGGASSRGSKACITIHPDDASAFFSNFKWNSSNPNVGTSKGKIIIKRNLDKE